jgi:hypothetical protein
VHVSIAVILLVVFIAWHLYLVKVSSTVWRLLRAHKSGNITS